MLKEDKTMSEVTTNENLYQDVRPVDKMYPTDLQPQETKMSVYSALTKRKTYEKRMQKLDSAEYVIAAKVGEKTIHGVDKDDIVNKLKAAYDSRVAVIRNYHTLNGAITKSNAVTELTVNGETYTVAEAISRMNQIDTEIGFLDDVKKSITRANMLVTSKSENLLNEESILDYVQNMMKAFPENMATTDAETVETLQKRFRQEYIDRNTWGLIDPYGLADSIDEKIDALKTFRDEFNEALNVSNIQTIITVKLF
jgi:hypothetical protein